MWQTGEMATLIALGIGQFAIGMARVAAAYMALDLGASAFGVGLVGGSFGALAVLIALPTGMFVDKIGERWVLIGGSALIAAAPLLQLSAGNFSTGGLLILMVGQALLGLGQTTLAIGTQTRVARSDSTLSSDERFARLSISAAVANMIAPAAAGLIIGSMTASRFGVDGPVGTFWAASAFGILALAIMSTVAKSGQKEVAVRATTPGRTLRMLLVEREMRRALLTSLVVLSTIDVVISYLPLVGEERDIPPEFIGLLLGVRSGAALVSRLALPAMLRRVGRNRVLSAMLVLSGLSLLGVAFDVPRILLTVFVFTLGFGLGVGQPLTMSWTAEGAGDAAGSALALRMTSNRAGQILVPTALGALGAAAGTGSIFVVVAVGLSACSLNVRRHSRHDD